MDSHYDQVMKTRAELEKAPARLYFAYSTVLDRAAFEEGKVAEAVGVDLVYDFPSRWWGGRVAGLADRRSASVYGLLIEIAGKDWPVIQHKEGAVTGMCIEREVTVRCEGRELKATAFTTRPERSSEEGPISARFVHALVRGAQSAGLPEAYIERIRAAGLA